MRKIFIKIISQIISIAIFVGVFSFALFITYGYRYDFEEKEVVQTSVIDVCTIPKQADLILDEELKSDKACQKFYGLDLGAHKLEINKDGYYAWNKNLYLDREKASLYPQIFLIPQPEFYLKTILEEGVDRVWVSPNQSNYAVYNDLFNVVKVFSASRLTPYIIEAPIKINDLIWIDNSHLVADTNGGRYEVNFRKGEWNLVEKVLFHPQKPQSNLLIKNNELWIKEKDDYVFVTRYGENIQLAQYFYNKSNLLIVTDNDIRVCDKDAENCHVVTEKDSGTDVAHPARSKKIIFVKDDILQQITLNGPSDEDYESQINE